jgi:hypothetical protein
MGSWVAGQVQDIIKNHSGEGCSESTNLVRRVAIFPTLILCGYFAAIPDALLSSSSTGYQTLRQAGEIQCKTV